MTDSGSAQPRLDQQLEKLVAGVVERIGVDPPELLQRLRPPELQVSKGPRGVNSYSVRKPDRTKAILLGADLYRFLVHYTRAAATYFLPSNPGGPRPSPFWHKAQSAVATTLDWMASPALAPLYPEFNLTPRQAHVASGFADCAYRFALCHEMAHVALGHLDADAGSSLERRSVGGEDLEFLRLSQNLEVDADNLGLELHYRSLPDHVRVVPGLVSAVYFCHATALALDIRLMLLSGLVDEYEWKISRTHPPVLERLMRLIGNAGRLYKHGKKALHEVDSALKDVDMQILDTANGQEEAVINKVQNLITEEAVYSAKRMAEESKNGDQVDEVTSLGVPRPKSVKELLEQFAKSPVGVLTTLEPHDPDRDEPEKNPDEARLRSLIQEQLSLSLPPEFQRFRHLTKAERARETA
jgi:hypothetical protein